MSDSVRTQRWQPTRRPHPWDSPGKNTGVGCHFLLQCMKVKSESEVTQSLATPRTAAYQAPPSVGFARQEYWSLFHSVVFLYFFALIPEGSFLISPCYSLDSAFKWVYLSFSILPFTFLFLAICKASSDNHLAFLHFFFLGMLLITASCTMSQTSVHSYQI